MRRFLAGFAAALVLVIVPVALAAVLTSIIAALHAYGLITDSTT